MTGEIDPKDYSGIHPDEQEPTLEEMITKEENAFNKLPVSEYKTMGQRFASALRLCRIQRNTWCDLASGQEDEESKVDDDQALKVLLEGE